MTTTELQLFSFPSTGQQVRSLLIDREPWFIAADVCTVLGHTNPTVALNMVDEDDRRTFRRSEALNFAEAIPDPRIQSVNLVNESGLYTLILRSNVPGAKRFKRWVTHEVLPAIRRTGSYSVQPQHTLPQSFAEALELAAKQARELEAKNARIAELAPGAARADRLAATQGLALVGSVAKRFGLKETRLRRFLHDTGLLIAHGARRNEPMARHIAAGYFDITVEEVGDPARSVSVTKVTPRGEAYIWDRLYEAGVVHRSMPPWQPSIDDQFVDDNGEGAA